MTQLFSRLLASHFPHPPGPLGDFKVRKGHGLRFISWEAEALSQMVTGSESFLLQSFSAVISLYLAKFRSARVTFDFHSFGRGVRSEPSAVVFIGADREVEMWRCSR